MNNLQLFQNQEFGQVRMVEHEGKPYAVGIDVAKMLEYAKPSQAIIDHCKGIRKLGIPSDGGMQETNIIPEGDIFRLIVKAADQSKNPLIKEKAEKIERWIFDDVIPTIRRHGMYAVSEVLNNPDIFIEALQALKAERAEKSALQNKIDKDKPLVLFAETCLASKDSILVRELAKLATKNGYEIGEKKLYQKLREWGLILKSKNEPSQRAMEMVLFEVRKGTYATPYGTEPWTTAKVTPKGQIYIIERLRTENSGNQQQSQVI